jgi:alkylhydroperoxidase/carboxymuconolactone decarboxylase family protein YurZ
LLDLSPDYLAAYLGYNHAPFEAANLDPKVCELIYVAVDGSVTHLYESGMARHMGFARKAGATDEEIMETIQLTMLTTHLTHDTGVPILLDEMERAGKALATGLSPEEQAAKDAYIAATGDWPSYGDALFRLAPHFVTSFLAYRAIPYGQGPLPAKVKEFICLAVCAAPTMLHEAGMRRHIRAALRHGATPQEISDVLQLASAISTHTCTFAVPALVATRAEAEAETDD